MLCPHNLVYIAYSSSSVFLSLSLFKEVPGLISILRVLLIFKYMSFLVTSITSNIASCLAPGVKLKASLIVLRAILSLISFLFFFLLFSFKALKEKALLLVLKLKFKPPLILALCFKQRPLLIVCFAYCAIFNY